MASSSSFVAGKGKRRGVSEDSPAFCSRILCREDLKDGMKPELFVEYVTGTSAGSCEGVWTSMADHIFLKVHNCGEHWKIKLRTSPRRYRIWLEKGWEEVASFFLLDQGDMATFSSEGECSQFHVSIYSWDDIEIEYPIRNGGADFSTAERQEIGTEAVAVASSLFPRSPAAVRVCGKDKVRRQRRRQTGSEAEARAISIIPIFSADEHEYDTSQLSSFRSDKPFLNIRIPAKTLSFRVFINQAFAAEHFYKQTLVVT